MEQENKEQVLTEVTSISKEEEKTGQKIELPSQEEMVKRASSSFITIRATLSELFKKLSAKQKSRVFDAVLAFPEEGLPVLLKTEDEKKAFALGQRALSDRFFLTYHYIVEELKTKQAINKVNVENNEETSTDNQDNKENNNG